MKYEFIKKDLEYEQHRYSSSYCWSHRSDKEKLGETSIEASCTGLYTGTKYVGNKEKFKYIENGIRISLGDTEEQKNVGTILKIEVRSRMIPKL